MDPGDRFWRGQPRGRRAPGSGRGWKGSARGLPFDVGPDWRDPPGHLPDLGRPHGPPRRGWRGPASPGHIPELFVPVRPPFILMPDPSHFGEEDRDRFSPEPYERWRDHPMPRADEPLIDEYREHFLPRPGHSDHWRDDEREHDRLHEDEHWREHHRLHPGEHFRDREPHRPHEGDPWRDPDREHLRLHPGEHFRDPDREPHRPHEGDPWRDPDREHHRLHPGEHWREEDREAHRRDQLNEHPAHARADNIDMIEELESDQDLSGLVGHIFEYNHAAKDEAANDDAIESQSMSSTMEADSGSSTPGKAVDWVSLLLGSADINSYAIKPKPAPKPVPKFVHKPVPKPISVDVSVPPPGCNAMFSQPALSGTGSISAPVNPSIFSQPPPQIPFSFSDTGKLTGVHASRNQRPAYNSSLSTPLTPNIQRAGLLTTPRIPTPVLARSFSQRPPVIHNSSYTVSPDAQKGILTQSKTSGIGSTGLQPGRIPFTVKLSELSQVLQIMNSDRTLSFSDHLERAVKRCKMDIAIQFYCEVISENTRITVHTGKLYMDGVFLARSFARSRENARVKAFKSAHDLVYNCSAYPINDLLSIKDPIENVRTQINEHGKTKEEVDEIIKKYDAKPPEFNKKKRLTTIAESKRFNTKFVQLIDSLKLAVRNKKTAISSFFLTNLFKGSSTGLTISYSAQPAADDSGVYHAVVYLGPVPLALSSSLDKSKLKAKVFELAVQKLVNSPIKELLSYVSIQPDMVGICPKSSIEDDEYSDGKSLRLNAPFVTNKSKKAWRRRGCGLIFNPLMYDPAKPTTEPDLSLNDKAQNSVHDSPKLPSNDNVINPESDAMMLSIDSWIETTSPSYSGNTDKNPIVLSDSDDGTDAKARSIVPSKKRVRSTAIVIADPILLSDDDTDTERSEENPCSSSQKAIPSGDTVITPSNESLTETTIAETNLTMPSHEIVAETIQKEANLIMPSPESALETEDTPLGPSHEHVTEREETPVMPSQENLPETEQAEDMPIVASNETVLERVQTEDASFISTAPEHVQSEDTPVMPSHESTLETVQTEDTPIVPSNETVVERVQTEDMTVVPSHENSPKTVQTEDTSGRLHENLSESVQTENTPVMASDKSILETVQIEDTPIVPSNETVVERVQTEDMTVVPSHDNSPETVQTEVTSGPLHENLSESVQMENTPVMPSKQEDAPVISSHESVSETVQIENSPFVPTNETVSDTFQPEDTPFVQLNENLSECIQTETAPVNQLVPEAIQTDTAIVVSQDNLSKCVQMEYAPVIIPSVVQVLQTEDTPILPSHQNLSDSIQTENTPIITSGLETIEVEDIPIAPSCERHSVRIQKDYTPIMSSIERDQETEESFIPNLTQTSLIIPSDESVTEAVQMKDSSSMQSNKSEKVRTEYIPLIPSNGSATETDQLVSIPPKAVELPTRKRPIIKLNLLSRHAPERVKASDEPILTPHKGLNMPPEAAIDLTETAAIDLTETAVTLSSQNVSGTVQMEDAPIVPSSEDASGSGVSCQRQTSMHLNNISATVIDVEALPIDDRLIMPSNDNILGTVHKCRRSSEILLETGEQVDSSVMPSKDLVLESVLVKDSPNILTKETSSETITVTRRKRTIKESMVIADSTPNPSGETPETVPTPPKRQIPKRLKKTNKPAPEVDLTENAPVVLSHGRRQDDPTMLSNISTPEAIKLKESPTLPLNVNVQETDQAQEVQVEESSTISTSENIYTGEDSPIILETVVTHSQKRTPKKSTIVTGNAIKLNLTKDTPTTPNDNPSKTVASRGRKRALRQTKRVSENTPEATNDVPENTPEPTNDVLEKFPAETNPTMTLNESVSEKVVAPRQRRTSKKSNLLNVIAPNTTEDTHIASSNSMSLTDSIEKETVQIVPEESTVTPSKESPPDKIVTPRRRQAIKKLNMKTQSSLNESVLEANTNKANPIIVSNVNISETVLTPRQRRTPKKSNTITETTAEQVPTEDCPTISANENPTEMAVSSSRKRTHKQSEIVAGSVSEPTNESVLEPTTTAPKRRNLKALDSVGGSTSERDLTVEEPVTSSNDPETVITPKQRRTSKKEIVKHTNVSEVSPTEDSSLTPNESAPETIVTARGKQTPKQLNRTTGHASKTVSVNDTPTTPSNEQQTPKISKNPRQRQTPKQSNVISVSSPIPKEDSPRIQLSKGASKVVLKPRQTRSRRGKRGK